MEWSLEEKTREQVFSMCCLADAILIIIQSCSRAFFINQKQLPLGTCDGVQ